MFTATEAEAAAILTAFEHGDEFAPAVELRRRFPGVTDNAEGARMRPDYRRMEAADVALGRAESAAAGLQETLRGTRAGAGWLIIGVTAGDTFSHSPQ